MTPEQLFEENEKFAYFYANRFKGLGEPEDLRQLALLGLYKASLRYDASKDVKFTFFASLYIKREIVRSYEKSHFLHISRPVQEALAMIRKHQYYDTPVDEILKNTYLSRTAVERAFACLDMQAASMDAIVYDYKDSSETLHDTLPDKVEDWDSTIMQNDFIKSLDEREQFIIKMRMEDKPQTEIGEAVGVSQMQISRILKKIQRKYQALEVELV